MERVRYPLTGEIAIVYLSLGSNMPPSLRPELRMFGQQLEDDHGTFPF